MSTPTLVLILRHGEKPADAADPDLSARGYERAAALAFAIPSAFATPDFLFASAASGESNRPVETITPLSRALHDLPINDKHKDKEYQDVAAALLSKDEYAGKIVCIAWHHGEIPSLAAALGAKGTPATWDEGVFDRVWRLDYEATGTVTFTDLPQRLLFGDTAV